MEVLPRFFFHFLGSEFSEGSGCHERSKKDVLAVHLGSLRKYNILMKEIPKHY